VNVVEFSEELLYCFIQYFERFIAEFKLNFVTEINTINAYTARQYSF